VNDDREFQSKWGDAAGRADSARLFLAVPNCAAGALSMIKYPKYPPEVEGSPSLFLSPGQSERAGRPGQEK